MINRSVYILLTFILLACANKYKKVFLKKSTHDKEEVILYESNKKHGYFISAVKNVNGVKAHYNLHLTDDGRVLNILKRSQDCCENGEATLDSYRDLQLLVTDTSKGNPNFFGNPIDGYYSAEIFNNIISDSNNRKANLSLLHQEEKQLFYEIDSLMRGNNLYYLQFDTSKVLGWFNYIF